MGGLRGQRRGRIAVPQTILAALQSALRPGAAWAFEPLTPAEAPLLGR